MAKILINSNVGSDRTINNDRINQAIIKLKYEEKVGHERNIYNMTHVDEYKSPGINKDASKVNDQAYYNLYEYKYEISYSSKQIEASKEPITETRVRNTPVGIVSVQPSSDGVGTIGRGGYGIT